MQRRVGIRNGALFNNNSTLWNGLLAYYTGDGTANDVLGNYNGTLVNGATYGIGKIGQGFSLDGVNDYIQINSSLPSFSSTQPHSYSAWVNISTFVGLDFIINNGNLSQGTSLVIRNNKIVFYFAGGNAFVQGNTTLTTNSWVNLVITFNGAGEVVFYLNGESDGIINITSVWSSAITNVPRLGSWYNTTHTFHGIMDEIGVWNKALTPTEVGELYNSGAGKQYPN
jgi:trimeric autotransporter adhesin